MLRRLREWRCHRVLQGLVLSSIGRSAQVFSDEASAAPELSESCAPVQELLASRRQSGAPNPPSAQHSPIRSARPAANSPAAPPSSQGDVGPAARAVTPAATSRSAAPVPIAVQQSAAATPAAQVQQIAAARVHQPSPAADAGGAGNERVNLDQPPAQESAPRQQASKGAAAGFGGFGADGGSDDDSYTEDAW